MQRIFLATLLSVFFCANLVTAQGSSPQARESGTKIPIGAKVNQTLFSRIVLTPEQRDSIVKLSEVFAVTRNFILAGSRGRERWDNDILSQMSRFYDKQRVLYRAVLAPEQRDIFDKNISFIMKSWNKQSSNPFLIAQGSDLRKMTGTTQALFRGIKLDIDQYQRVGVIDRNYGTKYQEIIGIVIDRGSMVDQEKTRVITLFEDAVDKFQKLLTPEQKKQFETNIKKEKKIFLDVMSTLSKQ